MKTLSTDTPSFGRLGVNLAQSARRPPTCSIAGARASSTLGVIVRLEILSVLQRAGRLAGHAGRERAVGSLASPSMPPSLVLRHASEREVAAAAPRHARSEQ